VVKWKPAPQPKVGRRPLQAMPTNPQPLLIAPDVRLGAGDDGAQTRQYVRVLTIERSAKGYEITVSPPHGRAASFEASTPTEVLEVLAAAGIHSTDATDALDVADPGWRSVHDAEVRHRRST
jgi:hypothetical protein